MLKLKQSLAAALLFTLAGTAAAQTQEQKKADKTQPQDVNVTNVVPTHPGVPPGAFSVLTSTSAFTEGLVSGPDPEGTSYAITSFTVAHTGGSPAQGFLEGLWGSTSNCRGFTLPGALTDTRPWVVVPAGETVHLSFPQPFVISARPGAAACLRTSTTPGLLFTVVGYRLPPAAQPQQ